MQVKGSRLGIFPSNNWQIKMFTNTMKCQILIKEQVLTLERFEERSSLGGELEQGSHLRQPTAKLIL